MATDFTVSLVMIYPSRGGPRYTMDTSVFPYTADTDGYRRLSGKPENQELARNVLLRCFLRNLPLNATPRNS